MSMIKVKIEKNRLNEPIFKLGFKKLNDKEERFLKRALIEGKEISGFLHYFNKIIEYFQQIDLQRILVQAYLYVHAG